MQCNATLLVNPPSPLRHFRLLSGTRHATPPSHSHSHSHCTCQLAAATKPWTAMGSGSANVGAEEISHRYSHTPYHNGRCIDAAGCGWSWHRSRSHSARGVGGVRMGTFGPGRCRKHMLLIYLNMNYDYDSGSSRKASPTFPPILASTKGTAATAAGRNQTNLSFTTQPL